MKQTFQVQVYPKMSFHWKAQALFLLVITVAFALAKLILPEWIVQNRSFELLFILFCLYLFYSKYINKSETYTEEPLTISADKLNFRSVDYSKNDIGFYRIKALPGATNGSVIKIGNEVSIVCSNWDLPNYEMYDGDYNSFKRSNIVIEQDVFDAIKNFKFNTI